MSNDVDGLNLADNQRLDRATEKGKIWTGNEMDTISSALNLPFLRRDQSTYMPHHCLDPVLGWVSISEPSCNSTFMLFESFYTHDLISSSRTGWASNIIPISKTEYVEWQRSNVTCSRPRWHESSNFDQCWSQSMLNTYYKSTLNNFFWKISNHFRRWGVVFRIELWKRKKKRLANVT